MSNQIAKEEITYFATTDFRNRATPFGIKHVDMPASPNRLWAQIKEARK